MDDFYLKHKDEKLREPRDVFDIIYQQEIFDQLKDDISEPDAVNIALELDHTTFNILSQRAMTLTQSSK